MPDVCRTKHNDIKRYMMMAGWCIMKVMRCMVMVGLCMIPGDGVVMQSTGVELAPKGVPHAVPELVGV